MTINNHLHTQGLSGEADVTTMVTRLREVFAGGRTRNAEWRIHQLTGIERFLAEREPEIGRKFIAGAAPHLTPVLLERGGKSPVVVGSDADLEVVARRVNELQFDRLVGCLAETSGRIVSGGGSDRDSLTIEPTAIVDPDRAIAFVNHVAIQVMAASGVSKHSAIERRWWSSHSSPAGRSSTLLAPNVR